MFFDLITVKTIVFSFAQILKTKHLDAQLILYRYKLDLMSRFMEFSCINPQWTLKQTTKELDYSDSVR